MAEQLIQVTEEMANFIMWANSKGYDEVQKMIRERLSELKAHAEATNNTRKKGETGWDDVLEPNDGNDQWKHGGDCNLCRKAKYCMTKCRANRTLKKITTPFLYQAYLDDVPEAAARHAASGGNLNDVLKQAGVLQ